MKKNVLNSDDAQATKELTLIPGVGKSVAQDLMSIGVRRIADLKGRDAEQMYNELNRVSGFKQNGCFLHVFRCAIYFAETPVELREPEKLNWWYWKDGR